MKFSEISVGKFLKIYSVFFPEIFGKFKKFLLLHCTDKH